MADASQLTVSILGVDGLSGPAHAAAGSLGALEAAAGRGIGAFTNMAAAAAKAALAVGAIGAGAVAAGMTNAIGVAASFEQQISAIAAVSSKTEVEVVGGMKAISAAALELGKSTSFSATEAAAGMEEMVKAGVSLKDVMAGGAKAALDLAAAGALSVSEAATIASSAMNAFGLAGSDLAHIADTLANAANASATDVHQLGMGLASVGAVAHTVGLSFEDTTTAIAEFAQAGLKGEDAGTSFKTLLLSLTPSTKPAIATMKELGIITADGANQFFDAQGKVKSFADISGVLQNAMKGLTKEQQLSALQTMFGTDAIRAAAIMAEKGAEGADKLTQAQKEVGGASAVAKERLNNLKGAMEALGGSWEVIRIKIGTPFLPILTKAAQALTEALNKAEPAISAFAERAAAGLDRLITRATAAGPRFLAMGAGLLAFGRQGLAVAQGAIPALVAGFDKIKTIIGGLSAGGITSGASSLFGGIVAAFEDIEPVAVSVGKAIYQNVVETFNFLTTRVIPPLVSIVQQIGSVLERTLLPAAAATGAIMRGIFGDTLDWLAKTVMPPFLSIVEQTSRFFTTVMLPTLPAIATALRTTLGETIQWLATDVWPKLGAAATLAWGFISGTIIPALPAFAAQIRNGLGKALEWIGTTGWPMLVKGATAVWTVLTEQVIPAVTSAVSWLKEKLPPAIAAVATAFEAVRSRVQPIIEALFNGDLRKAIDGMAAVFAEVGGLIFGWLKEQVGKIVWADVWAQSKDVAISLGTYVAGLTVDFVTWLGAQAALIPWATVWAQTVDVALALGTYLGGLVVDFATWLGAQVAAIPWATVWSQATEVATALGTYVSGLTVDFATWLGTQVAAIPWDTVWANVNLTAKQVIDALASAVGALNTELTRWLQEQIAATDWHAVGVSWGQFLGEVLVAGTQTAVDGVGPQLKPETIRSAMAAFFKGVFDGIWAEIGTSIQTGLQSAIDGAIRAVTPTRPNWWPQTVPWPFGPQAGAGMEFPYAPGKATPGQTSPGGSSRSSSAPSQMSGGATPGPLDNSSRESFIRTAYPWALQAANGNVQEANQQLAIAISENGDIGTGKDFSQTGFNFSGVHAQAGEPSFDALDAGRPTKFRAYANPAEGLSSFMQFLQANPRYASALATYQQTGNIDQLTNDANNAGYSETPAWATNIRNIRESQVTPITAGLSSSWTNMSNTQGPGSSSALTDFQATQRQWAQNASDAGAICGPRLASLFADAVGRPPTPEEARSLAESVGIYSSAGSGSGILNASGFDEYATALIRQTNPGVNASVQQTPVGSSAEASQLAQQSLGSGMPLVGFNTPAHYFGADQFNAQTGQFHTGGTGLSIGGGSEWMTAQEIAQIGGGITNVITLLGDVPPAAQAVTGSLAPVAQGMQDVGAQTADTSTALAATPDALAAVDGAAATTTNGLEVLNNGFFSMGEAVPAAAQATAEGVLVSFDTMRAGTLQSVTDLGTGVLTTTQDMSGNTIATVTDMTGQVTSQSATLASGVSLNMGDMATGVTTTVTDMGGTIQTVVTDAAGNAITTTTDMQGKVVGQFVTMKTDAGSAVADMAEKAKTEFGNTAKAAELPIEPIGALGQALTDIPQADMSDTVKQFGEAAAAAKKAQKAIKDLADASEDLPGSFGGSKSGSGKNSGLGKAAGGPVSMGQAYVVGENGPEFFVPDRSGVIIPNHAISRGGTQGSLFGGGSDYSELLASLKRLEAKLDRPNNTISVNGAGTDEVTSQLLGYLRREEMMAVRDLS